MRTISSAVWIHSRHLKFKKPFLYFSSPSIIMSLTCVHSPSKRCQRHRECSAASSCLDDMLPGSLGLLCSFSAGFQVNQPEKQFGTLSGTCSVAVRLTKKMKGVFEARWRLLRNRLWKRRDNISWHLSGVIIGYWTERCQLSRWRVGLLIGWRAKVSPIQPPALKIVVHILYKTWSS